MSYPTYDENLFVVAQTSNGGITVQTIRDDLKRVWHQKNLKGEVTGIFEFPTGNQSLPDHFANIGGAEKIKPGESVNLFQVNPLDAAEYSWVVGEVATVDYRNLSSITFPTPTTGLNGGGSRTETFANAGNYVAVLKSTFE